ncbi:ADP-ribosylglycohydrolase family protein [Streptomyces sp. NPDC005533]|uniref:ADP-ribosylglycohydrolase family protein n=1 Tax=Streptomyces sp. NPDC005533 TaxID=3364723 RepID=UPI00367650B6
MVERAPASAPRTVEPAPAPALAPAKPAAPPAPAFEPPAGAPRALAPPPAPTRPPAGASRTVASPAAPPAPAAELPAGAPRAVAPPPAPARPAAWASRTVEPAPAPAPHAPAAGPDPVPAQPPAGARRIEGLLLGLAAGDAAGWPAARHRASRMPEWTRRLTRELDTFAEQNATTTLPVPIALNQPPEPLRLGPSDDAEWAAFVAESVLTAAGVLLSDLSRSRRMRAAIDLAWNALASEVAAAAERAPEVESAVLPLRARISVRAGLGNLATGLRPPATGHDNPHYFDDAACIRACVLAVVHPGDAAAAADLAEFDARYTQDGDGVHGARAMAAAIATALTTADVDAAVEAALAQLPEATEIGRNARHAVALARTRTRTRDGGAFAIVPLLEHEIVDHVYSYGIAAAETVPVALALATAARGRVTEAVPAAACLSRVADSAPALAGALTGVLGGGDSIPAAWREACRTLSGCALPRLAGTDLVELAALLARTELTSPKPQGMIRT